MTFPEPLVTGSTAAAEQRAVDGKIALCLSGGGFRATLFHLGVMRYLRDAGLLTAVEHICAVSGGSIVAAHVVRHWARYTSLNDADFDEIASELIDFVKLDVRGRIVRRLPLSPFGKRWRRSPLVRQMFEELYGTPAIEPPTRRPRLHLLATNLTLKCLCSFEPDKVIFYAKDEVIDLPTETLRDALKVTTSSAFPAFFPPVMLTADDLGVDKERYLPDIQLFTDGGVYDNLGIRRLEHLVKASDGNPDKRLHLLLVSDAGRPVGFDLTRRATGLLKTAWRSNDIALARIGELDRRELSSVFDSPNGSSAAALPSRFQVLSISDEVPFEEGGNALPINIQRLVKAIRTDLDAFSDMEIVFLVQHGYSVARHLIDKLSNRCRPFVNAPCVPPIVKLTTSAQPVPKGRWLPPNTVLGWPRDTDALIWDNDRDKTKLGQCVAGLKQSGEIQLRWFSFRDRAGIASMLLVVALVTLLGYLGWRMKATTSLSSIPPVVYSSLGGGLDSGLFSVDPSMPGIEISERAIDIDIRHEVSVRLADLDRLRIAPSVHTYTINAVRRTTMARYLVYQFTSQRKLMDVVCVSSHPYQVRYRQEPSAGGDGFDNVYSIIIDLDQHSPDIPFTVIFRVTRWNAYQALNQNFVGALVTGDERKVTFRVLLPYGKLYRHAKRQERRQEAGVKWTDSGPLDAEPVVPRPDKTGFTWTLENPRQGWFYRTIFDWE